MTAGQAWGELVPPLAKVHWFYVLLMLVFISFAIFAVLNVVTSVFVDSAVCQTQEEQEHKMKEAKRQEESHLKKIKKLFADIDSDGSGCVSKEEFMDGLQDPDVVTCI